MPPPMQDDEEEPVTAKPAAAVKARTMTALRLSYCVCCSALQIICSVTRCQAAAVVLRAPFAR